MISLETLLTKSDTMLASTRATQLERLCRHLVRQKPNIVELVGFGWVDAGEDVKVAVANVPDHDGGV